MPTYLNSQQRALWEMAKQQDALQSQMGQMAPASAWGSLGAGLMGQPRTATETLMRERDELQRRYAALCRGQDFDEKTEPRLRPGSEVVYYRVNEKRVYVGGADPGCEFKDDPLDELRVKVARWLQPATMTICT